MHSKKIKSGSVTISGGYVEAIPGYLSACIVSGCGADADIDITITGGTVVSVHLHAAARLAVKQDIAV